VPELLTRSVLREQLRERILQRILDGEYAPGERIVESHLMKEYGVSQAPIREALRDLEAMRFVESEAHRGVRVRTITEKEMGEMYPVRAALEEVAGRAAAPQITDTTLDALEAEIGDVLFVCANLARHAQVDVGAALRRANAKFERRFRRMEELAGANAGALESLTLAQQDELWDQAKAEEKSGSA